MQNNSKMTPCFDCVIPAICCTVIAYIILIKKF